MNDLDSRLRAWNPVRAEDVSDAASSAAAARLLQLVLAQAVTGRTRLVTAVTGQGQAGRRHRAAAHSFPRWRVTVALASAAAVTAGTAYALTVPASRPAQAGAAGRAPQQATLAAKILHAAAAWVAREAATAEPSPGQWIYSAMYSRGQRRAGAGPTSAQWVTFDGDQQAYYKDNGTSGRLIVYTSPTPYPPPGTTPWVALNTYTSPMAAWDVLAALPADPHALLAVIAHQLATPAGKRFASATAVVLLGDGGAPATGAQLEFSYLTQLLWNTAGPFVPAPAEAAVYRAMATLPGITVQQGITNAAGAPAIGISDNGGYNQLLLSPVTYQVAGLRVISDGASLPGGGWGPKGTLILSLAFGQVTEVAAPGDR
jgi:hypothetical protein